ncbi:MAG: hypothetical protein LBI61_03195 [Puniceicoccales bacterium]|jgi:hypothetical protein|nr:hypothetical protein [Puniceicoccales bacterium]
MSANSCSDNALRASEAANGEKYRLIGKLIELEGWGAYHYGLECKDNVYLFEEGVFRVGNPGAHIGEWFIASTASADHTLKMEQCFPPKSLNLRNVLCENQPSMPTNSDSHRSLRVSALPHTDTNSVDWTSSDSDDPSCIPTPFSIGSTGLDRTYSAANILHENQRILYLKGDPHSDCTQSSFPSRSSSAPAPSAGCGGN